MEMIYIDLLTVIAAAIAYMIISAFWYSPILFGKLWVHYAKISSEQMKSKWLGWIGSFIAALILSFFLALLEAFLGVTSFLDGAYVGFGIWIGFFLTSHFIGYVWSAHSFKLFLIHTCNWLICLIVMGGIIGS